MVMPASEQDGSFKGGVCGYEIRAGLDMTTVNLCPSTRMNRKDSEGTRTSPVRPNNQPGDVVGPSTPSSGLLTSFFLPVRPTLAPRMSRSYSRNELGPALTPVSLYIHVPQALCVRFYSRAGPNPLLPIYAAAFVIKDRIMTLYRYLFYYACL